MNPEVREPVISSRLVVGLIVVGIGVSFLLDNLGLLAARDLIRYWPFGLIVVGLTKLFQDRSSSGRFLGGLLCVLGALFAADMFFFMRFDVWRWWPLAIVAFGLLIVLRALGGGGDSGLVAEVGVIPGPSGPFPQPQPSPRTGGAVQRMSEVAFWSGVERRVSSPAFKRADLTAIMGGIEFDLRQAGTDSGEAVIEVFVLWGGIEITVPPDWAVSNEVTAILGGADDQSTGTQQARNHLIVKGVVLMGGVDIKT